MKNRFHNPRFYNLLKAATEAASDQLKDKKQSESEDGVEFPCNIDGVIGHGNYFESCVNYLMEDTSIDRLSGIPVRKRRGEIKNTLLHQIKMYLGCQYRHNKCDQDPLPSFLRYFSNQTFDEYYAEYEQFLYDIKPIRYKIAVPLENFNCTISGRPIKLFNNIRIIPSDKTFYPDMIIIYRRWENEYPEVIHYGPPDFFLEINLEIERDIIPSQCRERIEHIVIEKVKDIFKVLRLYKEGDFRAGWIYWFPDTPCDIPYYFDDILYWGGNYSIPNKYTIKKNDIKKLEQLFQLYSNIKEQDKKEKKSKNDFLHSAIYYLNKGISQNDMADGLVDFTAALESLFIEGKQEITTLLAHRTAFFLEEDRQRCREIFKDIKKAYRFRCNIVHGDYHKIKDVLELNKYTKITERYARRAIIKWIDMIEKGKKRQDIYDSIEDNLFS